jgi:hypothetical protein
MSYSSVHEFLTFGLLEEGTEDMQRINLPGFLGAASARIDTYLRSGGYDVPIPSTTDTTQLKHWEWALTKWAVFQLYGFDFLARNAEVLKLAYDEAMKELQLVADGKLKPIPIDPVTGETEDADPTTDTGGAYVVTETARGWGTDLV